MWRGTDGEKETIIQNTAGSLYPGEAQPLEMHQKTTRTPVSQLASIMTDGYRRGKKKKK